MKETAYNLGDSAQRFGRWLVWRPLRLGLVLFLVVLVWLMVSFRSVSNDPTPVPTVTSSDGLPRDWQSWPKTTTQPR